MRDTIDRLIQEALRLIGIHDHIGASEYLKYVLDRDPTNLVAHNLRERHGLAGNFTQWMGVNSQISPVDDIFVFFANHPTSKNPIRDYLADGWRTMVELQEVLDKCGTSIFRCGNFLEFACGHGRFTRHLVKVLKDGQLTVSDVVPGSVDFLRETMGAKGFYSAIDPAALKIEAKYDVIFALSLFTHLPPATWGAWFQTLHAALAPTGLLIFSTHGEKCARLAGLDCSDAQPIFCRSSESSVLDTETYGCTYASIDYVERALRSALGARVSIQSIPDHFWGTQDATAVSA